MDEQKFMQPQDEITEKHELEQAKAQKIGGSAGVGLWGIVLFLIFTTIALVVFTLYQKSSPKMRVNPIVTPPSQEVKMEKPAMTTETTDVMPDDTDKSEVQVTEELMQEIEAIEGTNLESQLDPNQLNDL